MKRKIILGVSLFLMLLTLFALSINAAEPVETWDISATSSDNVTATLYDDGSFVISGYGNMEDWDRGDAPWHSSYSSEIKSVTIENGVTNIGNFAFDNCYRLTSVVIPDSVTSIGEDAFYYCKALTSVVIPDSVTSIGNWAFEDCTALTSIEVSANNKNYCSIDGNLYTKDLKTLIQYAVSKKDRNFTIPQGVETIGNSAFSNCYALTSIVIPDSVTTIGHFAFSNCTALTSVVIGDSVTSIGIYAFEDCTALTSVVIGDSVTTIGDYAFQYCYALTSIEVSANNENYCSIDGNLYTKDLKTLVQYAIGKMDTSFTIPQGVEKIGSYAFSGCDALTSIVIPDSVKTIGNCAFRKCFALTNIIIPNSVTTIGDYAFDFCYDLTIYCETASKPSGWDYYYWNYSKCPVVWGHTHTYENYTCVCGKISYDELLEKVFTFKGYSFNETNGSMAVGFDIDYEAKSLYEELTGKVLEIGVVFAGYDNLGGKQPLDNKGNAIALDLGKVLKANLTEFGYPNYDFILTDVVDSIKDVKLVISAYIFDGDTVKYVQENGIADTVTGISYNEAMGNDGSNDNGEGDDVVVPGGSITDEGYEPPADEF